MKVFGNRYLFFSFPVLEEGKSLVDRWPVTKGEASWNSRLVVRRRKVWVRQISESLETALNAHSMKICSFSHLRDYILLALHGMIACLSSTANWMINCFSISSSVLSLMLNGVEDQGYSWVIKITFLSIGSQMACLWTSRSIWDHQCPQCKKQISRLLKSIQPQMSDNA